MLLNYTDITSLAFINSLPDANLDIFTQKT